MPDARQHAPATLRNRAPLLDVLRRVLPPGGTVLEIASGTGEHAVHFAQAMPRLVWQPSDPDPGARASIAAWAASEGVANVLPPLALDAALPEWPVARADAIVCINMVHISPWAATLGLLAGAGAVLPSGAPLVLYGPYRRKGEALAASNAAFDESLKSRDPAWGLRRLEDVADAAAAHGLALAEIIAMPANNLSVVFARR